MGKYYAMLGDKQCGPYTLEELASAGVKPDTYVWTKGMQGWEHAEDDADICRYFRQRIVELQHPRTIELPGTATATPQEQGAGEFDMSRISLHNLPEPEFDPAEHDPGEPPPSGMLTIAILATLFCFPFTGAIAIYYAVRAKQAWAEALRSSSKESYRLYDDKERDEIRAEMSQSVRSCKMWTRISVFLGLIVYAAVIKAI